MTTTATATSFEVVADALHARQLTVRYRGDSGLTAQCPAHDDGTPSLSVNYRPGDPGRTLVHCHAGCDSSAVLSALSLRMNDLFDGSPNAIPYIYDNGREVVRTYPGGSTSKKVFQRHTEIAAELFRLGVVREAVAASEIVYIAEGEEDCATLDALAAPGRIAATTAPQGATNWHGVDYTVLRGGSVIIVADNDAAGTRRALDLADHLERLEVPIWCVMTAKTGNDVSDAYAAWEGEDAMTLDDLNCEPVDAFRRRVNPDRGPWAAVDLGATLDGLLAGTHEPLRPSLLSLEGAGALLYPGRVHGFMGESGSGKSFAAQAATARTLEDGGVVIYIDLEDGPEGMLSRLLALGASPGAIRSRFTYLRPDAAFDDASRESVLSLVATIVPTLVVIDSVGEAMALEGLKQNDDDAVALWMRRFPRSIAALGPAVLLIDHVVKAEDSRGLWAIGSQRKRAAIDGAAYLIEVRERDAFSASRSGRARIVCAKDRHGTYRRGQHVANMTVTPDGDSVCIRFHAVDEVEEQATALEADIAVMERLQPTSRRKARELSVGMSNTRADNAYAAWNARRGVTK